MVDHPAQPAEAADRRHRRVFVGLGANLGDRARTLRSALRALDGLPGTRVAAHSALYETQPVGGPPGQPPYLNAVARLETDLTPRGLLSQMQGIERAHGRVRTVHHGPRTLDLDLLLFDDLVIDEPDLIVPHARMWERDFVLRPLAELCQIDTLRARFAGEPHVR